MGPSESSRDTSDVVEVWMASSDVSPSMGIPQRDCKRSRAKLSMPMSCHYIVLTCVLTLNSFLTACNLLGSYVGTNVCVPCEDSVFVKVR